MSFVMPAAVLYKTVKRRRTKADPQSLIAITDCEVFT
jgi:hypothetical protein